MKKKYTVCLYDGSVLNIDFIVAAKIVEADDIDGFDHIAIFYNNLGKKDGYTEYQNRITEKTFPVYYERIIQISNTVHTYDFGSHSRFIAVFEGEFAENELKELLKTAYKTN